MFSFLPFNFSYFDPGVHLGTSRRIFLADTASTFTVSFLVLMAGALVSFMLAVSEYLLVYHTSSLTLSVAGVVKVDCIYSYMHNCLTLCLTSF